MSKIRQITYAQITEKFLSNLPCGFTEGDCWEWQGAKLNNGYGDLVLGSKKNKFPYFYRNRPHRFSYAHFNESEIPDGMFVCHKCDNPKCCNPLHLFLGTPKENMHDKIKKGRQPTREEFSKLAKRYSPKGSKQPKAKLHESDIPSIFEMFKNKVPKRRIAQRFNVTPGAIGAVLAKKTWKHVSGGS